MEERYICCHECDEISSVPYPLSPGHYKCPNCGHTLFRYREDMIEKVYALYLASLFLFIITNYFPLLSFNIMGNMANANLITGIYYMYLDGDYIVGGVIMATIIVVPLAVIVLSLMVIAPVYHGRNPSYSVLFLKILVLLRPWVMLDVFLVGILVSIVKLIKMGSIIPGMSLWAFVLMILIMTYVRSIFEPHILWETLEDQKRTVPKESIAS